MVERDDLVLLFAKCLSGLAHFVIRHPSQFRPSRLYMTWRALCGRPWVWALKGSDALSAAAFEFTLKIARQGGH